MESFLGQPIEVSLVQFFVAQFVGILVLVFDFVSFQQKEQKKYFLFTSLSSVLWVLMFALVGAQLPIILVASVSTVRNVIFLWAFRRDTPRARMIARRTVYVSLVVALTGAAISIPGAQEGTIALQFLLLAGVLVFVVCQYMPGVYLVRFAGVFYAVTVILVNSPLDTFNPVGIAIEANKIIAIIIFFIILRKNNLYKAKLAALRPVALELAEITA